MYCSRCGLMLGDRDSFCSACGSRIERNTPPTQYQSVQRAVPPVPQAYYGQYPQPVHHKSHAPVICAIIGFLLVCTVLIGVLLFKDELLMIKDKIFGPAPVTATLQIELPAGMSSSKKAENRIAILKIIRHRLAYLGYSDAKVDTADTSVTIKGIPSTADMDRIYKYLTSSYSFEIQDPDGKCIIKGADVESVKVTPSDTDEVKYTVSITLTKAGAVIFTEAFEKINARTDGKNYVMFVLEGKQIMKVSLSAKNKESGSNYNRISFKVPVTVSMNESAEELADILNSGGPLPVVLTVVTDSRVAATAKGSSANSTSISKKKITSPKSLYTYLKIPDNYHCKMILSLNGEQILNSEYWYKDGKGKMASALSLGDSSEMLKSVGLDLSKSVTFYNQETGDLYTCLPSLKVAVRMDIGSGMFYDQSNMGTLIDPDAKFTGTRAATLDGIQCTVYSFEKSGCKVDYYVRNSLEIVIRCVADTGEYKTDIYLKDMDIGMVTNGDVLMTNEYNNYKKLNGYEEFAQYLYQYYMDKPK